MSTLGQKQTCAVQQPMSALSPIATAKADSRKRSCPLFPRKRTCAVQLGMSAMGQKRTSLRCARYNYSMISSAIVSRPDGMVSDSALAVFRLSTSSNFVA